MCRALNAAGHRYHRGVGDAPIELIITHRHIRTADGNAVDAGPARDRVVASVPGNAADPQKRLNTERCALTICLHPKHTYASVRMRPYPVVCTRMHMHTVVCTCIRRRPRGKAGGHRLARVARPQAVSVLPRTAHIRPFQTQKILLKAGKHSPPQYEKWKKLITL